ncbi:MAG: fused MFS/spermidine synthase [Anaerolineae bacterium]|nr:fused MFS/spermidine synthase [Anaerolineae bacterium]
MSEARRNYLYFAVFTSGMTTLAVELTASRLLGSVFGTSNLIWANVIGLILLFLTAGYFLGGRMADRNPHPARFYQILLWGAFANALVPLLARPLLSLAASAVQGIEAPLVVGSFIVVLLLFAAPITLLGMASPFAIRLAVEDAERAGSISGRIYAIGTLGSLIGTFLPVLVITPEVGTFWTFLIFAALLYVVGLIGLLWARGIMALRFLWMPIVIAGLAALALSQPVRAALPGQTILYEDESAYNYIQVAEDRQGNRYLYLNEGQGVHSEWNPTQILTGRTWDFFLSAPYFNPPPYTPDDVESLAIVGLAAGTIARQYTAVYPDIPIDGIEIDPAIVEAGARYFDMNAAAMPNLTVYTEDARFIVQRLPRQYSVIGIDAYRPPYIPWQLCTVEFFREVRDRLTDDGVVVINVGRTQSDRRLVDALTATLLEVFPSVEAMDVPLSFNTILVATVKPSDSTNLDANLAALPADASPLLRQTLELAAASRVPVAPSDLVFTDDRAPVERLVDSLVLNFLLSGGAEQLRPN